MVLLRLITKRSGQKKRYRIGNVRIVMNGLNTLRLRNSFANSHQQKACTHNENTVTFHCLHEALLLLLLHLTAERYLLCDTINSPSLLLLSRAYAFATPTCFLFGHCIQFIRHLRFVIISVLSFLFSLLRMPHIWMKYSESRYSICNGMFDAINLIDTKNVF